MLIEDELHQITLRPLHVVTFYFCARPLRKRLNKLFLSTHTASALAQLMHHYLLLPMRSARHLCITINHLLYFLAYYFPLLLPLPTPIATAFHHPTS